ncbi:MAG: hypothetical protein KY433_10010 [Actinobacteria bacterium]|nr:hypothetical protein [Actinomycetota bacterium]
MREFEALAHQAEDDGVLAGPQLDAAQHGVRAEDRLADADVLWAAVRDAERRLHGDGRVLVRASGTEPTVRVMVEAGEEGRAREVADELADAVAAALGGPAA